MTACDEHLQSDPNTLKMDHEINDIANVLKPDRNVLPKRSLYINCFLSMRLNEE